MIDIIYQIIAAVGGGAISGIIIVAVMYTDINWIKQIVRDHETRLRVVEGKVK